jgi:predicted  nucleic acid-binding Zn-ribbon protein
MKKICILSILVAFTFIVSSCGSSKNSGTSSNNLNKSSTSNSYVEDLKTKLDEWNTDIVTLEGRADKFKGKVKADYEKELSTLRGQRDDIRLKLEQIQKSADNSWENIKEDLEKSRIKLQKSISNVQAMFK